MLFTDTITIYNYDNGNYQRHIIKGVQWRYISKNLTVSGQEAQESINVSLTFDFSRRYGNPAYYSPFEYHKLEDKTNAWTLDETTRQDVVVLGAIDKELDESYRLKHLIADYKDVVIVKAVTDNRNRTYLKNIKAVAE